MNEHAHIEDYADRIAPRAASRLLLWMIAGFFLILVLWASFTHIDRVTRAQGRVIPSSQLQIVSNLEGGVVAEILVKTGQQVAAGAPLLRLDSTLAGADFGRGQSNAAALEVKMIRLAAEVRGTTPQWPASLEQNAPELIAIERRLHAEKMAELSALSSAAEARAQSASQSLAEARIGADTKAGASASAQRQLSMIKPLVDKGIEPQISLVQAQNNADNAAGDASAAREAIGRANAGLAEARYQIAQARAGWLSKTAEELAQTRADLNTQRRILPAAADKMRRTTLTSPVAGTVNRVMVATPGGSVSPGQPLVEIVPNRDRLVVEAAVKPNDIAFIAIGQHATVKITAYDYSLYGSLHGEVTAISPDATVDPKDNSSHYMIRVAIDRPVIVDKAGRKLPVGAGMVAEVDLLGDKRTVMSYLLTPISRISETAFREH